MSTAMRVIFAAVAFSIASGAHADLTERTTAAAPRGEVEVNGSSGDVRVIGWDRAEVKVSSDLDSDSEELEVRRHGDRVVVEVHTAGGPQGQSDVIVQVPRESRLSVSTINGDQRVEDVRGSLHLESVSGEITVTDVAGAEFEARSVSGDVRARGKGGKGHVRITTSSGDIVLADYGDDLELHTVSGSAQATLSQIGRARLKTTNGSLKLAGPLATDARIDAEAINGEITLNLAGTINAEFDVDTFNGEINNCFGPKPTQSHEVGPGSELRFTEGSGGARVRAKTLNGAISICRKGQMHL
jgi:DUF4097 and DUF4098 domain-containing protein YvlB